MNNVCENIFQKARKHAGLTQFDAAELLKVDTRTLQYYEAYERNPDLRMVAKMSNVYHYPYLWYEYIEMIAKEFEFMPTPAKNTNLEGSAINVSISINKYFHCKDKIMELVADGVISTDERTQWKEVKEISKKIIDSLTDFLIRAEESYIHA